MEFALAEDSIHLANLIGKISRIISGDDFPNGDRARLRRMNPGTTQPPNAFYRFAFAHLPEGWERSSCEWEVTIAGLAIMHPFMHDVHVQTGKALAESMYSEQRLERILAAEGDVLYTLILRLARYMSAKAQAINWAELARLLFCKESQLADRARLKIARDYFRATREQLRG
jgi:CRISPR system Cascade subunit CasB